MMRSNTRCDARAKGPGCSSRRSRKSRAHIIGVKVSDTTAEMRIVMLSVMANSRNNRPTTSPMNNKGISTAMRDTVNDRMVKAICFDPLRAA